MCVCVWVCVDEVVEGPVQVPVVKPDVNKANPKVGVSAASFSANSRYMYTRNGMLYTLHTSVNIS